MKVVLSYLAGTLSGALMTVLAAWIVSGFLEPAPVVVRSAVLVLCAVLIWLIKEGPLGTVLTLPETRRQIPAQVFGGSLTRGAFHFGFELGTGVRTYVPSAAPYVLLVALVLVQPTLGTALLVAIGFGFGRALPLMVQFSLHDRQLLGSQLLRGSERLTSQAACLLTLIGALALV